MDREKEKNKAAKDESSSKEITLEVQDGYLGGDSSYEGDDS